MPFNVRYLYYHLVLFDGFTPQDTAYGRNLPQAGLYPPLELLEDSLTLIYAMSS